jgi:hypothetical protein
MILSLLFEQIFAVLKTLIYYLGHLLSQFVNKHKLDDYAACFLEGYDAYQAFSKQST